jgi:hypothetical protein
MVRLLHSHTQLPQHEHLQQAIVHSHKAQAWVAAAAVAEPARS